MDKETLKSLPCQAGGQTESLGSKGDAGAFGPKEQELAAIAREGTAEMIHSAISAGADPLARSPGIDGRLPLMESAFAGNLECLLELAPFGGIDQQSRNGWTALMFAATDAKSECVEALLAFGADPRLADHQGLTALMWACLVEEPGTAMSVAALAAAAPDMVDARNERGETALILAAKDGCHSAIRALAGRGDSLMECAQGTCALAWASARGEAECCRAILETCGAASMEARDKNGDTPLIAAAWLDQVECAQVLLGAGADVWAMNHAGQTALSRAWAAGSERAAGVLLAKEISAREGAELGLAARDPGHGGPKGAGKAL